MLRRYWFPIATESQLKTEEVHRVRLLGEDLVLFRDGKGRLGLVAERCTHPGPPLAMGSLRPRDCGAPTTAGCSVLRANVSKHRTRHPTQSAFGPTAAWRPTRPRHSEVLIFAYMGPSPAPAVPPYDLLVAEETPTRFANIGYAVIPCNWLQIMENSFDPLHVEWLHGRLFDYHLVRAGQEPTLLQRPPRQAGLRCLRARDHQARLREGQSELEEDWTVGHPVVFPNLLKVGGMGLSQFQIRTPMDDEHTLHFYYSLYDVPTGYEDVVTQARQLPDTYVAQLQGPDGSFLMNTIDSQDAMAWVTQGPITSRSDEHLCASTAASCSSATRWRSSWRRWRTGRTR